MAMADISAGGETDVSLIALTSHFAQVQFRLKQITSSPADKREGLLRQLEEYAFQGCPIKLSFDSNEEMNATTSDEHKQLHQLLNGLQTQLSELTGAPPMSPASFGKQTIILDELSKRFDVHFEDLELLSEDEVRIKVNEVITRKQKTTQKDIAVRQLISQVRSMEEHISQLQSELATVTSSPVAVEDNLPLYNVMWGQDDSDELMSLHRISSVESLMATPAVTSGRKIKTDTKNNKGVDSLQRTLALMQILTLWGCGGRMSSKHSTHVISEYPKAVRTLELTVDKILLIAIALNEPGIQQLTSARLEAELFEAVSMTLSDSLQELLEHGWVGQLQTTPTSCIPPLQWMGMAKLDLKSEDCIAWKAVKYYYHIKKGPKLCDKPDLKLSSSFRLPVDSTLKPKQTLLSSIYNTDKCFTFCRHYKDDVKFRSLVCQGFNLHHLHDWMRIIVNYPSLIDDLYQQSSFMSITKFRPVLQILERLATAPVVSSVTLPSTYFHHVNT